MKSVINTTIYDLLFYYMIYLVFSSKKIGMNRLDFTI